MERVLEKLGMNNVKLVNVPLASHCKLSSDLSPITNEKIKYVSCNICKCGKQLNVCDGIYKT